MAKMDKRSEANLAKVYPVLATKIRAASDALNLKGTFLCVVSGLRTAQEQNDLYAQGRTAPGHKVTNAKAGFSMHNYGLAVDVVPYLSGQAGALNWTEETPQYQAMVKAMKAQGLVWGGDWVTFPDGDHFQVSGLPDTPNAAMRKDYGSGDTVQLAAIWAKVANGAYAS
jgi:peptidoglycan L-alanyl-D-glutamate endopeptidase CwlK